MMRRLIAGLLVPGTVAMGVTTVTARTALQAPEATTVSAAPVSGPPGTRVVLPFSLATPEGVSVGTVQFRLTFPSALLKFDKVEPSGLAQGIGATVEAVVEKGPDAKTSTLRTSITAPAEGGSRQKLPSGPLVYVAFTLDKSAKPETAIDLAHVANASRSDDDSPVSPLIAAKVKIDVARPPVPACFFYMH